MREMIVDKCTYETGKSRGELPHFSSWMTVRKGGSPSELPDTIFSIMSQQASCRVIGHFHIMEIYFCNIEIIA
jgi:hypothetical protein